ncbi:MFS transporter [Bacteroidia bacterium]|nr:MFS transporter [Bacteroidia bacterium]
MFKNHPKGLYALALANTGERFGYYTMLAIFMLYLQAKFGFSAAWAGQIYSIFLAGVYFMPFFGGILADKFGFNKMVTGGIVVMFFGYLLLSMPFFLPIAIGTEKITMFAALTLIAIGTGLFKGNLQVLVGNLYDAPAYQNQRDNGFSLFYMAINIGAMFAPTAANKMVAHFGTYNAGFAVACVALIISIAIFLVFRPWYQHADVRSNKSVANAPVAELTATQTKQRITALLLVFAVVIFFWMSFHQNGATMTLFARDYTQHSVFGLNRIGFNIWNLVAIVIAVYSLFSIFQSKGKGKLISLLVLVAAAAGLISNYSGELAEIKIAPELFQQFNPFFVVCLTPVSMAIFAALARRKKEPSTPFKIGLGMLIAAVGFVVLAFASFGLASPADLPPLVQGQEPIGLAENFRISPNWLIGTYLVLTFGELLLSPMGISFVSKVAPPKYKGMMMGCWFAATAIGNYLVSVIAGIWESGMPLWTIWGVLIPRTEYKKNSNRNN